jgi:hypothetical protein
MRTITLETIENLHTYRLHTRGTLLCAPRRAGKSTFLVRLAESPYLPPTIITTNMMMRDCLRQIGTDRVMLPYNCRGTSGDLCIDEIDFIWSNGKLTKLIPWNRVVCATTSNLDFDRIQTLESAPQMFSEYSWIKHIAVVLPNKGLPHAIVSPSKGLCT